MREQKTNLLKEAERKCNLHLLTQMDQRPGTPSPIWTITHNKDLLHLKSKTNFRVRLLLGCHGLETDAAHFWKRKGYLEVSSSTCRLCMQGCKDPTHFMATCPALELKRNWKELVKNLPPALKGCLHSMEWNDGME